MGNPTTLPRSGPQLEFPPDATREFLPDRSEVKAQLQRILASPLFTSSKRYPGLLRYVVEHTLEDPACEIKERTIGIDVFGREPSYDTNHDPVVRTSAVEVRKRLIQYYQEPPHVDELRIELVVGSYVPRFRYPSAPATALEQLPATQQTHAQVASWKLPAGLLTVAALLALSALFWFKPWAIPAPVDQFWAPLWDAGEPVMIGISGGPGSAPEPAPGVTPPTLSELFRNRADYVPMGDVAALSHILASLQHRGTPFNLVYSSSVRLADLKSGPAILIGPINRWLEMMAGDLRFSIQRDQPVTSSWISDRENPARRDWSVQVNAPASSVAEAYALISRVWNPTTGQFMVCISGLSPYATSAAGEFASDPRKMANLLKSAPSGWNHRNVQIVIAATRVGTNVGIPRAVATFFR